MFRSKLVFVVAMVCWLSFPFKSKGLYTPPGCNLGAAIRLEIIDSSDPSPCGDINLSFLFFDEDSVCPHPDIPSDCDIFDQACGVNWKVLLNGEQVASKIWSANPNPGYTPDLRLRNPPPGDYFITLSVDDCANCGPEGDDPEVELPPYIIHVVDDGCVTSSELPPVAAYISMGDRRSLDPSGDTTMRLEVVRDAAHRFPVWSIQGDTHGAHIDQSGTITNGFENGSIVIRASDDEKEGCFLERRVDVGPKCTACQSGTCPLGAGRVNLENVDMSFDLGTIFDGKSAGELWVHQLFGDPRLGKPCTLRYDFPEQDEVTVTWDGIAVRQVRTPNAFVDVVPIDPESYEIRFYDPNVDGIYKKAESDWGLVAPWDYPMVFVPNEAARFSWRVDYSIDNLSIVKSVDGVLESEHTYASANDPSGAGALSLHTQTHGTDGSFVERMEFDSRDVNRRFYSVTDGASLQARTEDELADVPYKRVLMKRVVDPGEGHSEIPTAMTYYADADGAYRADRLESVVYPYGDWVFYDYDMAGRRILEVHPWLNADLHNPPSLPTARAISFQYEVSHHPDDAALPGDRRARTITESIEGKVVSRIFRAYYKDNEGNNVEIVERAPSQSAAFGDGMRTTTTFVGESDRVTRVEYPDGSFTLYTYEQGLFTANAYDWGTSTFDTQIPASDLRTTARRGTTAYPEGIPGKSVVSRRIANHLGRPLMEETLVYDGNGLHQIAWSVWSYGLFTDGRTFAIHHSDGTTSTQESDCCTERTVMDSAGVFTTERRDGFGNVVETIKAGAIEFGEYPAQTAIVSRLYRDALGRVVHGVTTDQGECTLETWQTYDDAGRLSSSTDEANLTTEYHYSMSNDGARIVEGMRYGVGTPIN